LLNGLDHHARVPADGPGRAFLRGGTISFQGRQLPCVVRALSDGAARLLVYAPDQLPRTFRLFIELNKVELDCELVWRRGKEVAVRFPRRDVVVPAHTVTDGLALAAARSALPLLVAEDDPDDRQMIRDAFADAGAACELQFVGDGEELLGYLQDATRAEASRRRPGLILLDLNMPRMDGRTALSRIKQHPDLRRIPVIVFTTSNAEEDIESTYDLGVSSYLPKPSSYEGLLEVVRLLNQYWSAQARLPGRMPSRRPG